MTSNRLATYVLWSKGSNQQFTSVHFVVLLASFRPVENSGEEGSAGGRAIMGYKDSFFLHNKQGISFFSTQKNTALSFKTTSIILVILRKNIIFAHSDAGSTASGVSFYRSFKYMTKI